MVKSTDYEYFELFLIYSYLMLNKKVLSILLLGFFVGTMFVGLFHMSSNMNMAGGESACPFMSHEQAICAMNLADHIETWKSTFLSIAPSLSLLLVATGVAILLSSLPPNLFQKLRHLIRTYTKHLHERTYAFIYRHLQELFSKGILHPKLF